MYRIKKNPYWKLKDERKFLNGGLHVFRNSQGIISFLEEKKSNCKKTICKICLCCGCCLLFWAVVAFALWIAFCILFAQFLKEKLGEAGKALAFWWVAFVVKAIQDLCHIQSHI